MYDVEEGTLEYTMLYLQQLGLEINEYKRYSDTLPVKSYEDLLEFSILILHDFEIYTKNTQDFVIEATKIINDTSPIKQTERKVKETHEKVIRFLGIPLLKLKTNVYEN